MHINARFQNDHIGRIVTWMSTDFDTAFLKIYNLLHFFSFFLEPMRLNAASLNRLRTSVSSVEASSAMNLATSSARRYFTPCTVTKRMLHFSVSLMTFHFCENGLAKPAAILNDIHQELVSCHFLLMVSIALDTSFATKLSMSLRASRKL